MRICHIVLTRRAFGGAERYAVDLTRGLVERGHEVLAIYSRGSACEARFAPIPNLHQYALSVSLLGKWDPTISGQLRRPLTDFQPDVVQGHLARGASMAGRAMRELAIPLVAHTHTFIKLKYYPHVDLFIPATQAQYDYLRACHIPAAKICLIPNFSAFQAIAQVRRRQRVRIIVSHGRLVHKKGFDLLLAAFSRINDHDLQLYLAGDGSERERLGRLVRRYQLQERVRLIGWQENIRDFLMQGDLFVLPSRDEPFGIALLEAMACGIPVVATDCHGPVEIVDESCAWLCAAGSADALTEAIAEALADPAGRQLRAENALQRYKAHYTLDKAVPQFEAAYQRLAASAIADAS